MKKKLISLCCLLILILSACLLTLHFIRSSSGERTGAQEWFRLPEPRERDEPVEELTSIPPQSPSKGNKEIYLILDDAGNNISDLGRYLALDIPFTVAVMPERPHTQESLEMIRKSGHSFILHQPMEPIGKEDPGAGAIMDGQNKEEIADILIKNIDSMTGLVGVNNHMGSLITSRERVMLQILGILKDHNLLFIDSLTTSYSAVKKAADLIDMEYIGRDIFLDNIDDKEAILEMFEEAINVSEKKGHAVVIGHVWSNELAQALKDIYPVLLDEGFTLKEISEMFLNGDLSDESTGR